MESKDFLEKWILGFLSESQKVLNDLPPCPFAKKSYLENKVKIIEVTDYIAEVTEHLNVWDDSYEVLIFVCPNNIDPISFITDVELLNQTFMPKNFVLLEDHKDIEERIENVVFNNGKYNLILAQRKDKLKEASDKLHKTKYYENWSKDYYDQVVSWRN
jgi:hypothetical protein